MDHAELILSEQEAKAQFCGVSRNIQHGHWVPCCAFLETSGKWLFESGNPEGSL